MNRTPFIQQLRKQGWTVEERAEPAFRLPPVIAARYPRLPDSLVVFLSGLSLCADATQTTWFLCQQDYDGTSGSAFSWDVWEQLSLRAADGKPEWIAEIRSFWDSHFPFMFSVHSGYTFYAVCTAKDGFGRIVEGCEPEFEEVTEVAGSFDEFLSMFVHESRAA